MSDYLSDEEQVARLQSWWRSYGVIAIVAILLAIAAVVGWRWYQNQQATSVAAASDLYTAYVEADDSARSGSLTKLLAEFPDSAYAQFALMDQAKRVTAEGNLDEAIGHYQEVLAKKPQEAVSDLANLRLARLLQQQEKSEAAMAALGAVRGSGFRSAVAELKGDVLLQQGDRAGAHEAYVAALAANTAGTDKPVLAMKENATSPRMERDSSATAEAEAEAETEAETEESSTPGE